MDGQLILASYWEVDLESRQDIAHNARLLESALCLHFEVNIWREKIWQSVEQAVASMTGLEKPRVSKCPFCESDYKLRVQNSMGGRMRIVLNIWRNYGRRYGNTLGNEQMFHRDPTSRIDPDALSRRDLHATFESFRAGDSAA